MDKKALRASFREKRADAHTNHHVALLENATKTLGSLISKSRKCVTVAVYCPHGSEPDILSVVTWLSQQYDMKVALPRIEETGQPLTFRLHRPGDRLVANKKFGGIMEPDSSAPDVTPDIIIVPLLAFDGAGHRLGQGGGFYDRTLQKLRKSGAKFIAVGAAYEYQETERLPRNGFDEPLDIIITENRVMNIAPKRELS